MSDGSMARRRLSSSGERLRRLQGRLLHVERERHATPTHQWFSLHTITCVPAFAADLRPKKKNPCYFSLSMCLASRRRSLCLPPGLAYLLSVCGVHRAHSVNHRLHLLLNAPCVFWDVMSYQPAPRTRSASKIPRAIESRARSAHTNKHSGRAQAPQAQAPQGETTHARKNQNVKIK
jgi:hypothetical protein